MSATTASQQTTTSTHTRLTRRGRVLVLLALIAVLFAAFSLGRAASQAAPPSAATLVTHEVTVLPGESLWTVARRVAPGHDPRDVIAQIRDLNDLDSPELRAGQQLLLPAAA